MKQIIAIVRPHIADEVLEKLRRAPVEAVTAHEVKGFNRQKSYLDQYGPTPYADAFLPKVEITLYVDDARAEEVIRKITDVTQTGRIGIGARGSLDRRFGDRSDRRIESGRDAVE